MKRRGLRPIRHRFELGNHGVEDGRILLRLVCVGEGGAVLDRRWEEGEGEGEGRAGLNDKGQLLVARASYSRLPAFKREQQTHSKETSIKEVLARVEPRLGVLLLE